MDLTGSLREIDDQLPNGFHDGELETLTLDYAANTAAMELRLWVGSMDAPPGPEREAYRRATVILRGLIYFVIEPPDPRPEHEYSEDGGVIIDAGDATDESSPTAPRPLRPLPEGAFAYWFYVGDWDSLIHVAAREAVLRWKEGPAGG